MFTTCGRVVTAAALACAPALAAPAPVSGLVAAGGWSPRTVLSAPGGWPADVVVSADGTMSAAWARAGDVEFAQRDPGGAWSTPETLVYGGGSPQLEVDRHGTVYLVWSVQGRVWKLKEQHSMPGDLWSPAVTVAHRKGTAGLADYDVAADGSAVAAIDSGAGVVVKRRSPDGAWAPPTSLGKVVDIDVELGGRGLAAAVLTRFVPNPGQTDVGLRLVEVTRQPLGGSWSRPAVLERDPDQGYDPSWPGAAGITVDRAGTATAAWYGIVPGHSRQGVATSRAPRGEGWSTPRLVIPRMGSEHRVEVEAARDRSVLVVAVRNYSTVLAALRPARSSWLDPTTVAPQGRFISGWDAARDPDGGAVVAWTRCPGPGFLCDSVWARVMGPGGAWGTQARLGRHQVPDGESTWTAMGSGQALVVWSHINEKTGHAPLLARTH